MGEVELTGEDATNLPVQHRGVGFVFQHYALFRHMTIRQNIAFGLEVRRLPKAEIKRGSRNCSTWSSSRAMPSAYPSQLSGGQRQRVALARAWPLDRRSCCSTSRLELDSRVRDELRTWLRRLHDEVHVTSLFVTHDQQEAFEVSDQIVVLNKGKIEQMGPPQELYEHPASPFVTEFLGAVNILPIESILSMDTIREEDPLPLKLPGTDGPGLLYVRPHDMEVTRQSDGRPAWFAHIQRLTRLGGLVRLELKLHDGTNILVQLTRERSLELNLIDGDDIYVVPKHWKVFPEKRESFVEDYVI